ncbi:MAG: 2-C-methyl-D-erythritol 2,4-cyclodiphosphate synthase [Spirochaetales bacterium]|nr:2-C-methyl-D-erythritol 2,4-cyclodiphosphate synthase [Spirochaetales bacterium]
MRIGQGRDLHRLEEGRRLILGGIEIPFTKGCVAHSDGDVLVHAVIDAIFGAAALGDIGSHFPDTDPAYRGADSMDLLAKAVRLLNAEGYRLVNVDSTVTLEKPKLRAFIEPIRISLARVLRIEPGSVSVKAKTNEGLDAAGRGEAVEAQAVVLIKKHRNR